MLWLSWACPACHSTVLRTAARHAMVPLSMPCDPYHHSACHGALCPTAACYGAQALVRARDDQRRVRPLPPPPRLGTALPRPVQSRPVLAIFHIARHAVYDSPKHTLRTIAPYRFLSPFCYPCSPNLLVQSSPVLATFLWRLRLCLLTRLPLFRKHRRSFPGHSHSVAAGYEHIFKRAEPASKS